jgi:protein-disulfide isomerase
MSPAEEDIEDLSRKERREQARAQRKAVEEQHAASAERRRRLTLLGGALGVVAVVVVVILIATGGSSGKAPTSGSKEAQETVAAVSQTLAGTQQTTNVLGSPTAPVTLQYFGDLECPICQAFTLLVLPTFVQQQVRTGKVKVVYRSICTATCDRGTAQQQQQFNSQQIAAYAAGKQNRFWQYADLFYRQQKKEGTLYATDAFLTGLARQAGVHVPTWQADRGSPALKAQLAADSAYATKAALSGTPTLIMSGKQGTEIVPGSYQGVYAFPSPSELAKAVQNVS